jgi:cation diffusion facilitator CzcD-associated flavoprotein CzcO
MTHAARANDCEAAVIGAGPYGLAVAAHLRQAGVFIHAFGEAMSFWRGHMPKGMRLRSAWHASHVSDPERDHSLDAYAAVRGLERRENVPLQDFVAYGEWFQGRAVPDLDRRRVRQIEPTTRGFRLVLDDGSAVHAARVVLATGLENQDYRPPAFAGLPAALVSHTSDHDDLARFRGRHVAVLGRGQSACESAVLLSEAGAEVELISRSPVHWVGSQSCAAPVGKAPFWDPNKVLIAPSGVGPFPLNWLNEMPALVHQLPPRVRRRLVARSTHAGAAAWLLPRMQRVTFDPGRTLLEARVEGERVALQMDNGTRSFDHVLLATGYRIDPARLGLLAPQLIESIRCIDGAPVLAAGFESSVPGLHFVGASAIASFGALNRFVAGCFFAARAVTHNVVAGRARLRLRRRAQGGCVLFADPKAAPR